MRLIRVFPLTNIAGSIYVIWRSLVQAYSYGACLQSSFPPIPNNIRPDKATYLLQLELINKRNQNIGVPKAKAIQSRVQQRQLYSLRFR